MHTQKVNAITKQSFLAIAPSFGGSKYVTKRRAGVRGEVGYDYLLGAVPIPEAGIGIGGESGELTLSGPIPGIGWQQLPKDFHGRVHSTTRSLYKVLADKAKGISGDESRDDLGQRNMMTYFNSILAQHDKKERGKEKRGSYMTQQEQLAYDLGFIKQARAQGYTDEQLVQLYKQAGNFGNINLGGGLKQDRTRASNEMNAHMNRQGAFNSAGSLTPPGMSRSGGNMGGGIPAPPSFSHSPYKPNSMAMAFQKPTMNSIKQPLNVAGAPRRNQGNALTAHQPMMAGRNKIQSPFGGPGSIGSSATSLVSNKSPLGGGTNLGGGGGFNPSPGKWGAGAGQSMGEINAGGTQLAMGMRNTTPNIKDGPGANRMA